MEQQPTPQSPDPPPRLLVPRSSYSFPNAERWLPYFNAAIETHRDVTVDAKWPGEKGYVAVSTMKNRMSDGLKWLAENNIRDYNQDPTYPYEQSHYQRLKLSLTLNTLPKNKQRNIRGGVLMSFNKRLKHTTTRRRPEQFSYSVSSTNTAVDSSWKEELLAYLQNPDAGIYHKSGLRLSQLDQDYVRNVAAGMEYKVTESEITVVK